MDHWKSIKDIQERNPEFVDPLPDLTSSELNDCVDIAKVLHLHWGATRMKRGYSYGPKRTPEHHPNLVQFDQLSEIEQQYDIDDTITTVRAIKGSGYLVIPRKKFLLALTTTAIVSVILTTIVAMFIG